MITEKDLQEAIAECHGVKNPDANTCIKLASYYTILQNMVEKEEPLLPYSYASDVNVESTIDYGGTTEFARTINGTNAHDVWSIMDELMSTIQIVNPNLYNGVMRKLRVVD